MSTTILFLVVTVGIIALMCGNLLLQPGKLIFKLAANSVLGLLILWLVNFAGGYIGFNVPLNPFTVIVTGSLGLPGLAMLTFLEIIIRA